MGVSVSVVVVGGVKRMGEGHHGGGVQGSVKVIIELSHSILKPQFDNGSFAEISGEAGAVV